MPKYFILSAVIMALFLSVFIAGCDKNEKKEPERIIRPVRYVEVSVTKNKSLRTFSGTARASVESNMSFKVDGTLQRLMVKVGDRVKQGQLLASLELFDYLIKVQEAEASLDKARAQARNASANYRRIMALYENNNVSRNELDAARAAAESSKAGVLTVKKQLEFARRKLGYTTLNAPDDCAVAKVYVEVNENITAGRPVVELACGSRLEVEAAVPEVIISRIKKNDTATVVFDAVPDSVFPAIVTEVGVSSTGIETTFPVTVKLQTPDERIRAGMAAEVTFNLIGNGREEQILIPPASVGEDLKGRFVFILEQKENGLGIVHRRDVTIGEISSGGLEVTHGLKSGDLLVTAGISRIKEGLTVKLNW